MDGRELGQTVSSQPCVIYLQTLLTFYSITLDLAPFFTSSSLFLPSFWAFLFGYPTINSNSISIYPKAAGLSDFLPLLMISLSLRTYESLWLFPILPTLSTQWPSPLEMSFWCAPFSISKLTTLFKVSKPLARASSFPCFHIHSLQTHQTKMSRL